MLQILAQCLRIGLNPHRVGARSELILRQAVRDLVVVALLGNENIFWRRVRVGGSMAPMATEIQSFAGGSQNRLDPHVEQKPRRTFGEDWYQVMPSAPVTERAVRGTFVDTK